MTSVSEPAASPPPIPVIQLAEVLAGAIPFKEGNINDTYRGAIWTSAGMRTAIIKDLDPRELANEVLAAAIGVQLGLPVPPAFLAFASPDRLKATKGPTWDDGRILFASVDVSQPQVAMLYRTGGGSAVLERLAQWARMGSLYGFDALTANIDRHAGNVLFSGDREVWLIDHGWCFTGPNWESNDLLPADRAVRSRLQEWLTPTLSASQRDAAAKLASAIELEVQKVDLRALAASNYMAQLLNPPDLEAVVAFLEARNSHVPRLAAASLDIGTLV